MCPTETLATTVLSDKLGAWWHLVQLYGVVIFSFTVT